jgi:hypothetical protein
MRSTTGLAAATTLLLAVPLALGLEMLIGGVADLVIHAVVGVGCLLLAAAMFDFGLPRWVNLIGAAAAGAFGAIFLLQAVSQVTESDALSYVAFDVLGQEIEGVLPSVMLVWFAALLLAGSRGASRILGWAAMAIVVGVEATSIVGPLLGIEATSQKLLFLLPVAWLLVESVKRRPDEGISEPVSQVMGRPTSESVA